MLGKLPSHTGNNNKKLILLGLTLAAVVTGITVSLALIDGDNVLAASFSLNNKESSYNSGQQHIDVKSSSSGNTIINSYSSSSSSSSFSSSSIQTRSISTGSSNSVIISKSSISSNSSSGTDGGDNKDATLSNMIITSLGSDIDDGLQLQDGRKKLSGKIASSQINLTNGQIEFVLFGDWLFHLTGDDTKFSANFTRSPATEGSNNDDGGPTDHESFNISNLKLYSVQQINDNMMMLSGAADISSGEDGANTTLEEEIPISIMINQRDGVLVISFEKQSEVSELFHNLPIVGIVVGAEE